MIITYLFDVFPIVFGLQIYKKIQNIQKNYTFIA